MIKKLRDKTSAEYKDKIIIYTTHDQDRILEQTNFKKHKNTNNLMD